MPHTEALTGSPDETLAESLETVDRLVLEALELPSDERLAFVDASCAHDPALAREVRSLVELESQLVDELNSPVFDFHPTEPEEAGVIGPYRVEAQLGQGGISTVYRAVAADGSDPRPVALKVLRSGFDPQEIAQRFRREGTILAGLRHPGIAQLLAGGVTESGRPYLAMELIEGRSLSEYLSRSDLPLRDRVRLFVELCGIVAYAHRRLVVHRDLKPSNVLVTAEGQPKLLDFGISKLLDPRTERPATHTLGRRWLTPEYAAPEQIQRSGITIATDVYSLGVMLYEALSGERPYDVGRGEPDWWRAVCEREPEPPSRTAAKSGKKSRARALVGDLDAIVGRCLRKEPEQRYASVERLADDLERYLSGLPVRARQGTVVYRAGKLLRRHRLSFAAVVLALVVLAGIGWDRELRRLELVEERDRAAAVNEFLLDIFRNANPEAPIRSEVTLKDMVALGTERYQRLEDSPRLRAELIGVLGELHAAMGDYASATPLLTESRDVFQHIHGDEPHSDSTKSLLRLGFLARQEERHEDARDHLLRAMELADRLSEDRLRANARGLLGLVHRDLGDLKQARRRLREAVEIWQEFPDRLPELSVARVHLALVLRQDGEVSEAKALLQVAMADLEAITGPDHFLMAQGYNNLAVLQYHEGHFDQAELSMKKALDACANALGASHSQTLGLAGSLAGIYLAQFRFEEAEQVLRGALDDWSASPEGSEGIGAFLLWNLSIAQKHQGKLADAEAFIRRALALRSEVLGEKHFDTARLRTDLGLILLDLGRAEEAERELRASHEVIVAALGPDNSETHIAIRKWMEAKLSLGRADEAAEGVRRLLDLPARPKAEGALRKILLARCLLTSAPEQSADLIEGVLQDPSGLEGAPSVRIEYLQALSARARFLQDRLERVAAAETFRASLGALERSEQPRARPHQIQDVRSWLNETG